MVKKALTLWFTLILLLAFSDISLGQEVFLQVRSNYTLASYSMFQTSSYDEHSVLSNPRFVLYVFSVASHLLLDNKKLTTLSKKIRDLHLDWPDPLMDIDLGEVVMENEVVYIPYRKGGGHYEAQISMRNKFDFFEIDKSEWGVSDKFGIRIVETLGHRHVKKFHTRMRDSEKIIKLPDYRSISFKTILEDALDIDEFFVKNKDNEHFRRNEHTDQLYYGRTSYYFGGLHHIMRRGPEDEYKVISYKDVVDPEGASSGRLLILYSKTKNAVTIMMEGSGVNELITEESGETRSERGWDRAKIDIYLDENSNISMIDHDVKFHEMGLSRGQIAIMLVDSGVTVEFPRLYAALKDFMVFDKVNDELRERETRDNKVVALTMVSRLNHDPASATAEDVEMLEDFVYYKSWVLNGLALNTLRKLQEEGVITRYRLKRNEILFEALRIREDLRFIERLMAQDKTLIDEILASCSKENVQRGDVDRIAIKWFGKGFNKNVYKLNFICKDGRNFVAAVSSIRGDPIGRGFEEKQINMSVEAWKDLYQDMKGVPEVFADRWAFDFRPRVTDVPITGRNPWDDVEGIGRNRWIYNNIRFVFRDFIEGFDLGQSLGKTSEGSSERDDLISLALQAYLDMWNETKDNEGKGFFIGDPKPANIVIGAEDDRPSATVIDLDALRKDVDITEIRSLIGAYEEYDDFSVIVKDGRAVPVRIAGLEEGVSTGIPLLDDMNNIHSINMKFWEASLEEKEALYLIDEELIPVLLRNKFRMVLRNLYEDHPYIRERVAIVSSRQRENGLSAVIDAAGYSARSDKVLFAATDMACLKNAGVRGLVFNGRVEDDFCQLEGIIAALRALRYNDPEKMIELFEIMTGNSFWDAGFSEDDIMTGKVVFDLKPAESFDDIARLERTLWRYIHEAA